MEPADIEKPNKQCILDLLERTAGAMKGLDATQLTGSADTEAVSGTDTSRGICSTQRSLLLL